MTKEISYKCKANTKNLVIISLISSLFFAGILSRYTHRFLWSTPHRPELGAQAMTEAKFYMLGCILLFVYTYIRNRKYCFISNIKMNIINFVIFVIACINFVASLPS